MISADRTALVVLAAGQSLRFGAEDKLLSRLAGQPLAAHVALAGAALPFRMRLAVCSSDAVAELFAAERYSVIRNGAPEQGMGHSLALALGALGNVDAVLVALADMPRSGTDLFSRLLAAFDPAAGRSVIASAAPGYRGPPALFERTRIGGVAFSGDAGARALLSGASFVEAAPDEVLDVDRPADLARFEALTPPA